ncbi:MAG: tRNA (adenosine(37)-N6)-threonylcarbamoyltransferase complex dimerization subunit type 1 TsaB [Chloroflexota bacterium]
MLLALDTATTTASIALYNLETDTLVAETTWQARRRHTQDVLPTVELMMRQMDVTPQQLTALAVTTGPGSFTGVRIGISTVKGMGIGLPETTRFLGVPTLSVMAGTWLDAHKGPVCATIQAGRGRFNWAMFDASQMLWRPQRSDHQAGKEDEFLQFLSEQADGSPILLVGELTETLVAQASALPHVQVVDTISGQRRSGQLARLAALHFAQGTEDTLAALQPLYLREP